MTEEVTAFQAILFSPRMRALAERAHDPSLPARERLLAMAEAGQLMQAAEALDRAVEIEQAEERKRIEDEKPRYFRGALVRKKKQP